MGKAVNMYHERMPSATKRKYLSSAREGIPKGIDTSSTTAGSMDVSLGYACSGSEIGYICMETVFYTLCMTLGVSAKMWHAFACETNSDKRTFIKAQFSPAHLFADVRELGQRTATCLIENAPVRVPWCFFFMAGFLCKCRSSASSKVAANLN